VNSHLILKRDDSQVTSAEFWNGSPETKPTEFLRLAPQRLTDNGDAPFLSEIRTLAEYLGFKVFGEAKLHALSLAVVVREARLLNGPL
jgi:hypothetical protein